VDKTAAGGGMISIYFPRDIKEMWEKVTIKCRREAGQVLLKKGECAGISQCVDFKNCQLHFPCVYSRESAAAMTYTQTKPDSMLPRYYVASCDVNMG